MLEFHCKILIVNQMKKIVLFILTFAPCMCTAQEEVKVTITDALALKTLSISYEHYATEQTSVGISGLFNLRKTLTLDTMKIACTQPL